jgi:hypothetical protein
MSSNPWRSALVVSAASLEDALADPQVAIPLGESSVLRDETVAERNSLGAATHAVECDGDGDDRADDDLLNEW